MATTDRRGRSHWCIDDDNDVDDDDDDEDEDDDADVDEKDWGGGCENGDAPGGATGAVDIAGRSQIWNKIFISRVSKLMRTAASPSLI